MAEIIEFPKQLKLFDWKEIDWEWWGVISTEHRPTEDAALENVYNQARIASGKLKPRLGAIERRIYMLELRSFRDCPRWFNEAERHQWISKQSGLFVTEIEEILETVDVYVFQEEILAEMEAREAASKEVKITKADFSVIVKEVMAERAA